MKNQKITFDFNTAIQSEEIAIMPASMAKKLLAMMADNMSVSSAKEINARFIDDLRENIYNLDKTVELAKQFIQTRELVSHVLKGDWDYYKVEPIVEPEIESEEPIFDAEKYAIV
jgi:hypothetical protein